jgi:carbamoyl-phosphate synthase small subunit
MSDIKIILDDGVEFHGKSFGYPCSAAGEVVFSSAMTGYPEIITDPAHKGQILAMTYPLIGNYGVPGEEVENNMPKFFESDNIQVSALIVTDYSQNYSHWGAGKSLDEWMKTCRIHGIYGLDTRALTRHIREKGNMPGRVIYQNQDIAAYNPYSDNLAEMVSCKDKIVYGNGSMRIMLVDCGVRNSVIRELIAAGATVVRVPWDYNFLADEYDGLVISSGPGDPKKCKATIQNVAKALQQNKPIIGTGLGSLIMGLAADADTFKMKYGHHGNNQPVNKTGSNTAFITEQNHNFAIDTDTIPDDWEPYYVNLNDETNEGIRHKTKPFFATQFPFGADIDSDNFFGLFIEEVKKKN